MGAVLVIANVSIGRAELTAALDARATSGTSIHVLSPVTPSSSWAAGTASWQRRQRAELFAGTLQPQCFAWFHFS